MIGHLPLDIALAFGERSSKERMTGHHKRGLLNAYGGFSASFLALGLYLDAETDPSSYDEDAAGVPMSRQAL